MSRRIAEIAALSIHFDVDEDRPDWPTVGIEVNGRNPFEAVAEGWRGFDPADMLGGERPLLPFHIGRRVAVYCCSCGEPGCGVIAPWIERSPDGRLISWSDFRDYVGAFNGPVRDDVTGEDGEPWELPAIYFAAEQYEAEVRRAAADRSWETPRRVMARLVEQRMRDRGLGLTPDFRLDWVSPAWQADGVDLAFETVDTRPGSGPRQVLLRIPCDTADPHRAAGEIVHRLSATAPEDRIWTFGWGWQE